jgi:hypothetical protein
VFENKESRKIYGHKKHSQSVVRTVKCMRLHWVGHVARMGRQEICRWEKCLGKRPLGISRNNGRIILKSIFRN